MRTKPLQFHFTKASMAGVMSAAGGVFAHQAMAVSFQKTKLRQIEKFCCIQARVTGRRNLVYLNLILFFAFLLRTLLASTVEACTLNICGLKLCDLDGGVWGSAEMPHPLWRETLKVALGVAQNYCEQEALKAGLGRFAEIFFGSDLKRNWPQIDPASKQPRVYAQPSAKKANQSLRENSFHGPCWSVSPHRIHDPPRTRTWNLRLRRPTPYPLGQRAIIFERLCQLLALFSENCHPTK